MKSIEKKSAVEYLIYQLNANNDKYGPEESIKRINSYYKKIAKSIERYRLYSAFTKNEETDDWWEFINSLHINNK